MKTEQDLRATQAPRQPYQAPQLVEFGRVHDLTAGGSGVKGEKSVPGHQYTRRA